MRRVFARGQHGSPGWVGSTFPQLRGDRRWPHGYSLFWVVAAPPRRPDSRCQSIAFPVETRARAPPARWRAAPFRARHTGRGSPVPHGVWPRDRSVSRSLVPRPSVRGRWGREAQACPGGRGDRPVPVLMLTAQPSGPREAVFSGTAEGRALRVAVRMTRAGWCRTGTCVLNPCRSEMVDRGRSAGKPVGRAPHSCPRANAVGCPASGTVLVPSLAWLHPSLASGLALRSKRPQPCPCPVRFVWGPTACEVFGGGFAPSCCFMIIPVTLVRRTGRWGAETGTQSRSPQVAALGLLDAGFPSRLTVCRVGAAVPVPAGAHPCEGNGALRPGTLRLLS